MTGTLDDLSALIARLAIRKAGRTEADVQSDIQTLLLWGGLDLEDAQVQLESPAAGRRRIDVEIGFTAIECKRDLTVGNVKLEGIEQLRGYVVGRTSQMGQRYAGILTDGRLWSLYHLEPATQDLREVNSIEISGAAEDAERLSVWLEAVLSTAEAISPTPLEIERRLGAASPAFALDLAELTAIYEATREHPDVRMKRELWSRLLAAALGRNFADDDVLFIEHTYLVIVAEVVAHAVMGIQLTGAAVSAGQIVSGEIFHTVGIDGVVEEDFFDWPITTEGGERLVLDMARRLSRFAWQDEVEHDVLKILYESVIDARTRHQLGEYYTPDWLAQRVVDSTVDDPLNQRVLDPACGSGTFVFWALRRFLEAADAAGIANKDALEQATQHVFGIDLHPVAVTLARVTYLLAIGSERLQDRGALSIPIYLGDSIQVDAATSVLAPDGITVHTDDGLEFFARELAFPESVVADPARFDRLVDALTSKAGSRPTKSVPGIKVLLDRHNVPEEARATIRSTFGILCHLHDVGRDHIWGYYVRNLARPLEFTRPQHRVDRIVGNPPWLRYNAMPAQMQADFKKLAQERNVWAPAHVVTSQDLSALFLVRSCELYLGPGGRFGMVMPAAALSRPQYKGFRTGKVASETTSLGIQYSVPWELSRVDPQPFPVPAAVVFGSIGDGSSAEALPEQADWFAGRVRDHHKTWEQIEPLLTVNRLPVVVPSETFACPYGTAVLQGANFVPRMLLVVVDQASTALGVPAGQRAVTSDRGTPERAPWNGLQSLQGVLEDDFLRPMYLGESVLPYRLGVVRQAVVPWDGSQLLEPGSLAMAEYVGLESYWSAAEAAFKTNRPERTARGLVAQINHMNKLRLQFPVARHRVIYTGRGGIISACRVEDQLAVVDHALYWLATGTEDEARYVTGVLNSRALQERTEDAMSKGLLGPRNIHRSPFLTEWPQFDPTDPVHLGVVEQVAQLEGVAAAVDLQGLSATSAKRRRIRDSLNQDEHIEKLDQLVDTLLGQTIAEDSAT